MDLDFTITDEWQGLSKQEQQQHLFLKQKGILDTFLARRVISQEQYDISLHTLVDHMTITPLYEENRSDVWQSGTFSCSG